MLLVGVVLASGIVSTDAVVSRPEASVANASGPPVAAARHSPFVRAAPAPAPPPPPPVVVQPVDRAADTTAYDLRNLPVVDVFSVNAALPIDDDPFAPTTGMVARSLGAASPVFAEPGAPPVAQLPRVQRYGDGVVPVVAAGAAWVKVLLAGRHAVPPQGDSHQTYGWMRRSDVALSSDPVRVEVSIGARTIDVVDAAGSRRVASDFAWGAPATPTPVGRTFIMMTALTTFAYARGHAVVYLATQSPTLGGFGGVSVAVTAFHYFDVHSGPVSNGCIQLDASGIDQLARLPAGTVVDIRP